jgi:hypothetical protein
MDGFSYKRENDQNVLTIYKKISSAWQIQFII